jgi:hypothetical protein
VPLIHIIHIPRQRIKNQKLKEQNANGGDNYNTMKKTTLDRNDLIAEQLIREHVRKKITKKLQNLNIAEQKIRTAIRTILEAETGTDEPSAQTGINVLADLLEKIIPTIEADYKMLTTSEEQRESFRNHVVHAIKNSLRPIEAATSAEELPESTTFNLDAFKLQEELKIDLDPDSGEDSVSGEFIDIDSESSADADDFVELDDQNETGRNFAAVTFQKVEKQIVDAYDMLADNEDQDLFYDYLVTNMLLYFDKFEDELQPNLPDVTTPEYEDEKNEKDNEEEASPEEDSELDDLL